MPFGWQKADCELPRTTPAADRIAGFSSLLGAAGDKTHAAFELVRGRSTNIRYCSPSDAPVTVPGTDVRVYTLGPPRDDKLLHTLSGSATSGEMYGLDAASISPDPDFTPFDPIQTIPIEVARGMPFFRARYFGESAAPTNESGCVETHRYSLTCFDATQLALQLDSYTNNTSLVLGIRTSGRVACCSSPAMRRSAAGSHGRR